MKQNEFLKNIRIGKRASRRINYRVLRIAYFGFGGGTGDCRAGGDGALVGGLLFGRGETVPLAGTGISNPEYRNRKVKGEKNGEEAGGCTVWWA